MFLGVKIRVLKIYLSVLFFGLTIVLKEILNSETSYKSLLQMLTFGNSYILSGPIAKGNEIIFRIMSDSDNNFCYKVSIRPKGVLQKSKRDVYKNFFYTCQCPSKKFNTKIFCKHIAYVLMLLFKKS